VDVDVDGGIQRLPFAPSENERARERESAYMYYGTLYYGVVARP
jgi:hypothetical protein